MQANFFSDPKAEAMAKEGLGDRCPWFAKEAVLKPRDSLVASPGYAFVSADYSQVIHCCRCSSSWFSRGTIARDRNTTVFRSTVVPHRSIDQSGRPDLDPDTAEHGLSAWLRYVWCFHRVFVR